MVQGGVLACGGPLLIQAGHRSRTFVARCWRIAYLSYDRRMFRFVLIVLMLLQPLQWAWSAVHATADTAHALGHESSQKSVKAIEKAAACGLVSDTASSHACHDNHTHNSTVLGVGYDDKHFAEPSFERTAAHRDAPLFDSALLTTIERPKWIATR